MHDNHIREENSTNSFPFNKVLNGSLNCVIFSLSYDWQRNVSVHSQYATCLNLLFILDITFSTDTVDRIRTLTQEFEKQSYMLYFRTKVRVCRDFCQHTSLIRPSDATKNSRDWRQLDQSFSTGGLYRNMD